MEENRNFEERLMAVWRKNGRSLIYKDSDRLLVFSFLLFINFLLVIHVLLWTTLI